MAIRASRCARRLAIKTPLRLALLDHQRRSCAVLKVDAMNPFSLIPDKWVGLVKAGAVVLAVVLAVVWWGAHNAAQQQIGYDRRLASMPPTWPRRRRARL